VPTYTYSRTFEQLRDMIGRKLGVKESGQALPTEEAEIIEEGIELRLKELHALGVLWWQVAPVETDITLTAGVESAALPADFLFPVSAVLMQGAQRNSLDIVSKAGFFALPDRTAVGAPERAFFGGGVVRLNPVPQDAYTLRIAYQAIAADTETGQPADIPVEALRAFSIVVAHDLADDFAVDPQTMQRLQMQAPGALLTIRTLNHQRATTSTIQPEWF
jgi:hypothetical protein